MQELPSSEQKAAGQSLSHNNGGVHHSTEKLPNGTEAAATEIKPKAAASESKLKTHEEEHCRQKTTWFIRIITYFLFLTSS